MRKNNIYTPEFKIKIVKEYLNGRCGTKTLAKKYNIKSSTQVKDWIKQYKEFGELYFYEDHRGRKSKQPKKDLESMTLEEQIHY